MDYTVHSEVLEALTRAQDDDQDQREQVRDAGYFCNKKDGQWEPDILKKFTGRPRHTYDLTTRAVKRTANQIKKANFACKVTPDGAGANKDVALALGGMVRKIESMSGAKHVYNSQAYKLVEGGFGAWEVVQDWADTASFNQDLFIRPIEDAVNRVWFDENSMRQDKSDSSHVFVLQKMTTAAYKKRWPDGTGTSVQDGQQVEVYAYKPEMVTVGRIIYKKEEPVELILMSDGSTYERNEDFDSVVDDLAERGITIAKDENGNERIRKTTKNCFYSRIFDGSDWLTEPQKTVFDWINIIPVYGNYHISDGKTIYRGEVLKLMDAQRDYNYGKSRELEEVALAPRGKYWMTKNQAKSPDVRAKLQTLNTNADPVQFFDNDPEVPGPPPFIGGAQVNQGLVNLNAGTKADIDQISGDFGIQAGQVEQAMSGLAIEKLSANGDAIHYDYFESMEIAIEQTCRLLINAIPKVYEQGRVVQLLNENGTQEQMTIAETVFDQQTGRLVTLNDLSQGKYAVTVEAGAGFKTRQEAMLAAVTEFARLAPDMAEISADQIFKNLPYPGMDDVAARYRQRLLQSGVIPFEQMTEEEQQQMIQAAQQPQEPDPASVLAQAEVGRVQAETADILSLAEERRNKAALEQQKLMLQAFQAQQKQEADEVKQLISSMQQNFQNQMQAIQVLSEALKDQKEAMGADAVISQGGALAYQETTENLSQANSNLQLPDQRL